MKNKITKRGVFAVSAKTIDERKPEVVALMQRYGMNVNVNDSKEKIDMAFLSLLPRSRSFRQDFAKIATPVAENVHSRVSKRLGDLTKANYKNYGGDDFFNIFGLEKKDPMADVMNIPSKGIRTSSNSAFSFQSPDGNTGVAGGLNAKRAKEKSGFGSWLTDVFDKDTTQNIINTGLGIYAYQKTGGTQGAPNPLNQGRADVAQGNAGTTGGNEPSSGGLGTGGIVAISLGAIALVGFGIYYATKK
jgi:hypothetical protein